MYDEHDSGHVLADPDPMFTRTVDVPALGRIWHFEIASNLDFRRDATTHTPALILAGGLLIDSLLYGLFVMLTRSNRRALSFAKRAGAALRAESDSLQSANRELETFAYAVSHDLKTPLNGIGYLADFIEEDLADSSDAEPISPEVPRNVQRIQVQVRRAHYADRRHSRVLRTRHRERAHDVGGHARADRDASPRRCASGPSVWRSSAIFPSS